MAIRYPEYQDSANEYDLRVAHELSVNGNVGVGTTTPTYPLDATWRSRIRGSGGEGGGLWLTKNDGLNISYVGRGTDSQAFLGFYNLPTTWVLIVQDSNGRVGIGTTRPNSELEVNGTMRCDNLRIDQSPSSGSLNCNKHFTIDLNGNSFKVPCKRD